MPRESKSQRIIRELTELTNVVERGEPLKERYTVTTVRQLPSPKKYDARLVRRMRQEFGVSQAVFAQMLAVSTSLVQSWEQGFRKPSPMACRLLDEIHAQRARWLALLSA